jgi:hypothetical protein
MGILDFAPMIDRFAKYLHITLAGLLSATRRRRQRHYSPENQNPFPWLHGSCRKVLMAPLVAHCQLARV